MKYPPSVIVSETMRIAGSARRAMIAPARTSQKSTIEPTTRAEDPSALRSTTVVSQSCAASRRRCSASKGLIPAPTTAQSRSRLCSKSLSR